MGFAKGVGEDDARAAFASVVAPPRVDVAEDRVLIGPTVDWKAKGAFGDERVAADGLEGVAGGVERRAVRRHFVIASDDADFACGAVIACGDSLDADLGGAKDVTCGVQRDADVAHRDGLAEGNGFDFGLGAHAQLQDA